VVKKLRIADLKRVVYHLKKHLAANERELTRIFNKLTNKEPHPFGEKLKIANSLISFVFIRG